MLHGLMNAKILLSDAVIAGSYFWLALFNRNHQPNLYFYSNTELCLFLIFLNPSFCFKPSLQNANFLLGSVYLYHFPPFFFPIWQMRVRNHGQFMFLTFTLTLNHVCFNNYIVLQLSSPHINPKQILYSSPSIFYYHNLAPSNTTCSSL